MANVKAIIAAHLSQRQRNINRQVEREDLLDQDRLLCNIIRVDSNIAVPSRPGFVWCQEYSPSDDTSPFHAFNDKVQAREGLAVWVGPGLGGRREVLDWNNGTLVNTADYAAQKYLPTHHTDHEWPDFKPGPDVVNVYPRSLSMLRTYPGEGGALTVSASPLSYIKSNAIVLFPGKISLDISASQPASGLALFVGIYLDTDDNTLKSVDGATAGDSPAIIPDSPTFPESAILSANVRLNGDQTTFSEVDMVDVRHILDAAGAIDGTRVSKLVSPDGLTDPVLSADNSGDVTITSPGDLIVEQIYGGDGSADDLTLNSTNHATKGLVVIGNSTNGVIYNETNNQLGFGTPPSSKFHVSGVSRFDGNLHIQNGGGVRFRNNADTAYRSVLSVGATDNVSIGATTLDDIIFSVGSLGSIATIKEITGFVGINGITAPSTELDIGDGAIEFEEMTAPGAGAANTTRLYAEDSGGTTRQQIVFNGGNTVTIAQDGGLQTYTPTNVVTDRSYDADATSVAELADVLGTLIADFQAAGILG